ncbi:hypothetical protein ACCQ08_04465 [Comamonas sp. SY3]|uniref:hypothetical protein n=1 Tax=Comamonas sp. SY3 TaxID=3243601 RepID=UPI0035934769
MRILLSLYGGIAYATYRLLKRRTSLTKNTVVKPLLNLQSKKHWPTGEKIKITDDGTYTANITKVAGNTFGDYANRNCAAFLIPELKDDKRPNISVYIDGLLVGHLTNRHTLSFYSILQHAKLLFSTTSCNAHIGEGGTGLDGKKLPYLITLDINWF